MARQPTYAASLLLAAPADAGRTARFLSRSAAEASAPEGSEASRTVEADVFMNRPTLPARSIATVVALATAACGGDSTAPGEPDNQPPTIATIADRAVTRNTLTPRSVTIDLEIQDPDDDSFTVTVTADDPSVIPPQTLSCGMAPCPLTLTPAPDRTTRVGAGLTVSDGRGGEAQTSFAVDVVPIRVTRVEDAGPGSLRDVVMTAEPGDVIGFDTDGAFATASTIALQDEIVLDRVLTLEGPGADHLTVSGGSAVRIFRVTGDADAVVSGMTITEGRASVVPIGPGLGQTLGGGILVEAGSALVIRACTITGNTAAGEGAAGGGVANLGGTLAIRDGSEITSNVAPLGAGVGTLALGGSPAVTTMENSAVSGNSAALVGGGALSDEVSTLVIDGGQISHNTALAGGGIASGGTLIVRAGTRIFENTSASVGGGIYGSGSTTITDSEVENNTAGTSGGGVFNDDDSVLTIQRGRIAGNTVSGEEIGIHGGGGIYGDEASVTTIHESVIEGNGAVADGGGILARFATVTILAGSLVGGNEAGHRGGGILNGEGNTLTLEAGVSVTGNSAGAGGGGIYNDGGTLDNSADVSDNTPDEIAP